MDKWGGFLLLLRVLAQLTEDRRFQPQHSHALVLDSGGIASGGSPIAFGTFCMIPVSYGIPSLMIPVSYGIPSLSPCYASIDDCSYHNFGFFCICHKGNSS